MEVGSKGLPHRGNTCIGTAAELCFSAGTFKLTLEFSEEYPNKAPVVKFKSKMFHPNSAILPLIHLSFIYHVEVSKHTDERCVMQSMRTAQYAWTSYKISGHRFMTSQRF